MFSRPDQLKRRTKETDSDRPDFLRQLIHEFTTSRSFENRKQTLANLANFAYDPINYEFIKQLHLTDLFLAQLSENVEDFIHFALAGLCNLSCDPESREYIVSLNGIYLVSQFLLHKNEEIALNAITTLYYLFDTESTVVSPEIKSKVARYLNSANSRFKNLATLFLEKYK